MNNMHETGEVAGAIELAKTSIHEAVAYGQHVFEGSLFDVLPNFKRNYHTLKILVGHWGTLMRHQMPAIEDDQMVDFAKSLKTEYGIHSSFKHLPAVKLRPVQAQIYIDKVLPAIKKFGIEGTKAFYAKSETMISAQHRDILDGHHRWSGAIIIDPKTPLAATMVHTSRGNLFSIAQQFTDKYGNIRNA